MHGSARHFGKDLESASLAVRARQATGEWLADLWPWDVFGTLTFAGEVSKRAAGERFTLFAQRLARERVRGHVGLAWFCGTQQRGVLHFHVLAAALESQTRRVEPGDVEAAWPWGDVLAERVAGRGAVLYGMKHTLWDVNVACPRPAACRRSKGCLLAPGPWQTPSALTS